MKRVLYHWVEIRTAEVPDECPTDDVDSMIEWFSDNGMKLEDCTTQTNTRDLEIVEVEDVVLST